MQGHSKIGVWDVETPALIRFVQLTHDEYFVSEQAAKEGVRIVNHSKTDPIDMLKHFGPENPDLFERILHSNDLFRRLKNFTFYLKRDKLI